jgi:ribonucleoside-diphosphate reductase beta chain
MYMSLYNIENIENFEPKMDPILEPSLSRFTLFPIQYEAIWKMVKQAQSCVWFAEELDLSNDMKDWNSLNENEQHFIKYVLAFFAASDGIVNENLHMNFASEVQISEARAFYAFQEMIESVHNETYSLLIDSYIKDSVEKNKLFNAIETIPIIRRKADWAMKWFTRERSFAERLVAFACVEGIHFSGSFCAIFWLKKRGLMPGLCTSNSFISRDEGLHRDFAILLHKTLQKENQVSESRIHEIVREAVDIECEFISEALPVSLIGMNVNSMVTYIKFVGDHLLSSLWVSKLYHVTNPFDFMDMISMGAVKTNFFESRVSEYSHSKVGTKPEDNMFNLNEDF